MRDPKRIDRMLALIAEIWKKHPDMRFGQMMINAGLIQDDRNIWNIEDDEWEEHIKKEIKRK